MNPDARKQPRRPIEREYLATLNAAVPLETWQAICKRAADDALAGDARARDFLAKWLLGVEARPLTRLAAEVRDSDSAAVADAEVDQRRQKIDDDRESAEAMKKSLEGLMASLRGNCQPNRTRADHE
jgi:hypothetical protein